MQLLKRRSLSSRVPTRSERRRLPFLRTKPYEFHAGSLEIVHTPSSPIGRAISWTIMLGLISAFAWAWFGSVDVVVAARGRVLPSGKVKIVQAPETAQVRAIHVHDGEFVRAGTPVVTLDPTEELADIKRLEHELTDARATAARLKAVLATPKDADRAGALFRNSGEIPANLLDLHDQQIRRTISEHVSQLEAYLAEAAERQAEIEIAEAEGERLNATLPLLREQVHSRRGLVASGILPRLDQLQLERQLIDAEKAATLPPINRQRALAAKQRLAHLSKQIEAQFMRNALHDLIESERRADNLSSELAKANYRRTRLHLTAPVDGYVQQIAVRGPNAIVTTAQAILSVVPQDAQLEVEARIENRDVGWIRPGQQVAVKIEAFDFTKFGLAEGRIHQIDRDAIPVAEADPGVRSQVGEPVYLARILLSRDHLKAADGRLLPLASGMSAVVEIKVSQRRVIDYLLSPILEYAHDGLREP